MNRVRTSGRAWWFAGVVAGVAGLAASYCVAMVMTIREAPVVAVAELVIRLVPGAPTERAIDVLGHHDKTVLVAVILLLLLVVLGYAGRLARRAWWAPLLVYLALAAVGLVAVANERGSVTGDYLPVVVGLIAWPLCLALVTEPLRRRDREAGPVTAGEPDAGVEGAARRSVLVRGGSLAVVSLALGALGRRVGSGRRHVEATRRLLRLPGVTRPRAPGGVRVGLPGATQWATTNNDFYRIHTAIVVPTIEPADWRLRIHGMVDREVELSFQDLLDRRTTQAWITLNCVSNPVGGPLIGNAWWSGVRIADLLAEAGVKAGADAVLQTSDDGWTCGTPLGALTDDRNAMLAVAMNGEPLPIEHGFPVRTVVPGLYGYVSACKWVVDLEVTRFSDFQAYWTTKGWSERGPVKMSSRIDVPSGDADVPAGQLRVGGVAWAQHVGVEAVEVALDGGAWQRVELARTPSVDSWVQWAATLDVEPGDHLLRVRATDRAGLAQTGVDRDVLPDGSTGWHEIDFTAQDT